MRHTPPSIAFSHYASRHYHEVRFRLRRFRRFSISAAVTTGILSTPKDFFSLHYHVLMVVEEASHTTSCIASWMDWHSFESHTCISYHWSLRHCLMLRFSDSYASVMPAFRHAAPLCCRVYGASVGRRAAAAVYTTFITPCHAFIYAIGYILHTHYAASLMDTPLFAPPLILLRHAAT